jgi:ribulose bisphosphate carboxylase small subunit
MPNWRDRGKLLSIKAVEEIISEIERLQHDLAECYRLSGADPDGDDDWRLAERAVTEVKRMRGEYDAANDALVEAERQLEDA